MRRAEEAAGTLRCMAKVHNIPYEINEKGLPQACCCTDGRLGWGRAFSAVRVRATEYKVHGQSYDYDYAVSYEMGGREEHTRSCKGLT